MKNLDMSPLKQNAWLQDYLDGIIGKQRTRTFYNPFLVYCRELTPGTVSLTGDRAQGDDSKYDSQLDILAQNKLESANQATTFRNRNVSI